MFDDFKNKTKIKKLEKQLSKYDTFDLYKYTVEVKCVNEERHIFGKYYKFTNKEYKDWVTHAIGSSNLIRTDDNIHISRDSIVSIKLLRCETIKGFRYIINLYNQYESFFSDEEIKISTDSYNKLIEELNRLKGMK